MRDHVMGVRAVTGRGEVIHSGGRVLKNVTGLDLCKLLTGSHGTLGIITEITLKVLPAPEAAGTIVIPGLRRRGRRWRRCRRPWARRTAFPAPPGCPRRRPSLLPGQIAAGRSVTLIRIEDFAASVTYRTEKLRGELGLPGAEILDDDDVANAVAGGARRAGAAGRDGDGIWRVSVRPSSGPGVLRAVPGADGLSRLGRRSGLARRSRDRNDPPRDRGRRARRRWHLDIDARTGFVTQRGRCRAARGGAARRDHHGG